MAWVAGRMGGEREELLLVETVTHNVGHYDNFQADIDIYSANTTHSTEISVVHALLILSIKIPEY